MTSGRNLWLSKTVSVLERPLGLDQKYGLLEINPQLFGPLTTLQTQQISELHSLTQSRRDQGANPMIENVLNLFSAFSSVTAENVRLTRPFLLKKTAELTGNSLLADAALQFYEKHFDVCYAQVLVPESADEFERFYQVALRLAKKEQTNIYALADAYLKVFPENKTWLRSPDFKDHVIDQNKFLSETGFRPTFMRVVPTRLGSAFPFAEITSSREPIENYFRFRKQVNQSLAQMPKEKQSTLQNTKTYVEFVARVHLAMIYYHFFEELNGRLTRVMMNFLNVRRGFLPFILNADPASINEYKLSNQVSLVAARPDKWKYDPDTYRQFAQLTINLVIAQQIKVEKLYSNLKKIFS